MARKVVIAVTCDVCGNGGNDTVETVDFRFGAFFRVVDFCPACYKKAFGAVEKYFMVGRSAAEYDRDQKKLAKKIAKEKADKQ